MYGVGLKCIVFLELKFHVFLIFKEYALVFSYLVFIVISYTKLEVCKMK